MNNEIEQLEKIGVAKPILRFQPNPWMEYMRAGDFESAWKITDEDVRKRVGKPCFHLPRIYQYFYNGESLEGKRVLVRCYHGLGDTIQFIRYATLLKTIAAEVIVWAQPALIPILSSMSAIDKLLPLNDGAPQVEYDTDIEVMELPYIFRSTVDTIPCDNPYLSVEKKPLADNGKLNVGLVWKAGDYDPRRGIPFSFLLTLSKCEHINFYILQADAEQAGWHRDFGVYPGPLELNQYAQVIASLDLMISVDSMPAHLAGALGVPVWNLLHAEADWRWMSDRLDTPWYPTMKLFRQERMGDWRTVINRVKEELDELHK